jgi:hypothetical protein
LDPILGRAVATYSHALPIDTNYIKAHALLFEKLSLDDFNQAMTEFTSNLDNHIGRVTAKWKEQGVYIAVTNVSGWFDYGIDDNVLRQVFLTELFEKTKNNPPSDEQLRSRPARPDSTKCSGTRTPFQGQRSFLARPLLPRQTPHQRHICSCFTPHW